MILVLFTASPNIALPINIHFAICRIEQSPHSDVKLSFQVEHRTLNELLNHKGVTSDLLISIGIDVLSRNVVVVVSLEDWGLVSGSTAYAIAIGHYVTELVEVREDVDAYSSVEAGGLQQPQVLLFVRAFR